MGRHWLTGVSLTRRRLGLNSSADTVAEMPRCWPICKTPLLMRCSKCMHLYIYVRSIYCGKIIGMFVQKNFLKVTYRKLPYRMRYLRERETEKKSKFLRLSFL